MNSIKYILTIVVFANSTQAFAGAKEAAETSILQSHVAAKTQARILLKQDLDLLIQNMMLTSQNRFPRSGPSLPEQINILNQRIVDQLDQNISIQQMDVGQLNSLVSSYEGLVRERFRASFTGQELVTQKFLALRAFELPFEGFASMCRTGRSAVNVIGAPAMIPRLPDAEYSIFVTVGTDGNKIEFTSANPTPASAERNKGQIAVGTAAGISAGMAAQVAVFGATSSAAATMVIAAAPYLAAAYLAYAVINGVITNDEAVALQNESAEANVNLMHRSATDRDVARYYTEACKDAMKSLQPVYEMIQEFRTSDAKRAEIMQALQNSREARRVYSEAAQKITPIQALLRLASYIEEKKCEWSSATESVPAAESASAPSPCRKNGSVYSLTENPAIKIDTSSDTDKKLVAEALVQNKAFVEKYPREIELIYHSHAVMESIVMNWNDISAEIENSSFQVADQTMNALAKKLRAYIYGVQSSKNSTWAKSTKLLGAEQKLQDQYFSLRAEYFQLLTNALKIFFNRAEPVKGKQKFQQFLKRFDAFAAETNIHPDVQAMRQSVQNLKRFYEKL